MAARRRQRVVHRPNDRVRFRREQRGARSFGAVGGAPRVEEHAGAELGQVAEGPGRPGPRGARAALLAALEKERRVGPVAATPTHAEGDRYLDKRSDVRTSVNTRSSGQAPRAGALLRDF